MPSLAPVHSHVSARGSIRFMLVSMRPGRTAKRQRKRADLRPTEYTTLMAQIYALADVFSLWRQIVESTAGPNGLR